nr:MAG TPA: hypothetical protein [Caudoviricetes sp.]
MKTYERNHNDLLSSRHHDHPVHHLRYCSRRTETQDRQISSPCDSTQERE